MPPMTPEQQAAQHEAACALLEPQGWTPMGYMLFFKDGKVYDLSASDLAQMDRIEHEGLCVVAA